MIEGSPLIIIAVFLPIVIGFILLFPSIGKFEKKKHHENLSGILTALTLTFSTGILIWYSIPVWSGQSVASSFQWAHIIGLKMTFLMDNLSTPIVLLVATISAVTSFYAIKYMEHEHKKSSFFGLYNLFSAGMIGSVLAGDLIEFLFFWEMMLIPSFLLILQWGTKEKAVKSAIKYFFYTQTGTIGLIIAFSFIGFYSNSFSVIEIIANFNLNLFPPSILILTFVLLLIGFSIKMAISPFQNWLPDAHGEAPVPISVLLSGAMLETAGYALIRFCIQIFGPVYSSSISLKIIMESVGAFTLLYGGFLALVQKDIKRLLAYSSVSQMGYIFFGIATFDKIGVAGALIFIIANGFGKGLLFLAAGIVIHSTKTRDLDEMGGLSRKMPVTAIISFIGALNLAGLPPLIGFFGEWLIFTGALDSAITPGLKVITIIFLIGSLLSAAYLLRFLWKVFLGPLPEKYKSIRETSPLMWITAGFLALSIIVSGFFIEYSLKLVTNIGI